MESHQRSVRLGRASARSASTPISLRPTPPMLANSNRTFSAAIPLAESCTKLQVFAHRSHQALRISQPTTRRASIAHLSHPRPTSSRSSPSAVDIRFARVLVRFKAEAGRIAGGNSRKAASELTNSAVFTPLFLSGGWAEPMVGLQTLPRTVATDAPCAVYIRPSPFIPPDNCAAPRRLQYRPTAE